ncbi:MAG: type II toxin-antitoxin system HicB family antitoxin [Candidatus Diapherotrites archaeon]
MSGVMEMKREYSAVITKGKTAFVAFCPELDVVSQGRTEKSAFNNLKEAVELYLEDEDVQKMLLKMPPKKAKISSIAITA